MSEHKIVPCPFCGSSDISDGEIAGTLPNHFNFSQSECNNCGACGTRAYLDPGEVDYGAVKAKEAWNTRAESNTIASLESQLAECRAVNLVMRQALEEVKRTIEDSDHWWMDEPGRGGFDADKIRFALETKSNTE